MSDISMDDAPVEMDNEEASAWAQGYNAAIAAKDAENERLRAALATACELLRRSNRAACLAAAQHGRLYNSEVSGSIDNFLAERDALATADREVAK